MEINDLENAREWQATAQKIYADILIWLEFLPGEDARILARRARSQLLEAATQVSKLEGSTDPLYALSVLGQVPEHRLLSHLLNKPAA
nr:hypothetical protein [Brucella anthropi]